MANESHFRASIKTLAALSALAVGDAMALDPMPVKMGPVDFVPTIGLAEGYDNNVQQAPNGQQTKSAVTRITPQLLFRARDRANRYEFSYLGLYELISASSINDRFNHTARASTHLEFGARHRLDLVGSFEHLQDVQNLTNRTYNENGNVYNRYQVGAVYGFGALTGKGQLELDAKYVWLRYQNNLYTGSYNEGKDYNSPRVKGTFYYRVAPKTRLLVELGYAQFNYISPNSLLDSFNLNYLAGVTWQATAKTRGTIKAGYEQKNFSSNLMRNTGLPSWDLSVTWTPTERADITLGGRGFIDEGASRLYTLPNNRAIDGNWQHYIDTQEVRLSWKHKWKDRFNTEILGLYMDQKYKGGTYDGRHDKTGLVGLRAIYNLRRWVDVALEVNFKNMTSTMQNAAYDRNWVFLSFNFSL